MSNKVTLVEQPNLKDFQKYVLEMEKERGLQTDLLHNCLLVGEKAGELFKARRKSENHQIESN